MQQGRLWDALNPLCSFPGFLSNHAEEDTGVTDQPPPRVRNMPNPRVYSTGHVASSEQHLGKKRVT